MNIKTKFGYSKAEREQLENERKKQTEISKQQQRAVMEREAEPSSEYQYPAPLTEESTLQTIYKESMEHIIADWKQDPVFKGNNSFAKTTARAEYSLALTIAGFQAILKFIPGLNKKRQSR